jgi:RNA recognition motif-containing protein
LAYDVTEVDLEQYFNFAKACLTLTSLTSDVDVSFVQTKSIKIIKDREDKPKGFAYIEFESLDGLKDALAKSGTVSARVHVVDPVI